MLVRALSTISAGGVIRHKDEEFRVGWSEAEAQQYEADGVVVVLDWEQTAEDTKPRRGAPAKAAGEAPVDAVLYKRIDRLEQALANLTQSVSELSLCRLAAEEVEAIRAALGTAASAEEPPEVPYDIRTLLDAEDEGHDVAAMLEASRVDDLRAIANDMAIPNLHGRMTKAALIAAIVAGLDEQRERYAARTAWEDAQAEG